MHLIVEPFNFYDTLTSLYKSIWQPLHPCTGGSHCGVCVLFGFLLYCWHDEGNWSVGLVNQCQPGWADCIWWSCSDQMASWHHWRGVYVYVRARVCVSVYASVLGRVKWVWIAISCDCSFRNIYWNSAHTHRDYGPPAGATGTKRFVAYVSDLRVCGIQQFSRTHYKSIHIISELSRHVVQVM